MSLRHHLLSLNTQTPKIALITGGSRGLGRNTAESLSRKGIDSLITYNSRADEARKVVTAIQAEGRQALPCSSTQEQSERLSASPRSLSARCGKPGDKIASTF
jgi:NAD(P)-dependent dehydrogenase (short-subunit alcohol dehydrogenase family)